MVVTRSMKLRKPGNGGGDSIRVDRISDLPAEIIYHILSFCPTDSVLATKRWRRHWTKLTSFFVLTMNRGLPEAKLVNAQVSMDRFRLKMDFFSLKFPPVVCLPKLTRLLLRRVNYESGESFRRLVSGCPVLESLEIHRNLDDNMEVCTISSLSSLKRLCYVHKCRGKVYSKLEIVTPALEYVYVDDLGSMEGEDLRLSCYLKAGFAVATNNLSRDFERLTKLFIKFAGCNFRSLMDLIDHCAALDELHIETLQRYASECDIWKDPTSVSRCLLSSLTRVSYKEYQGHQDDKGMLRFIVNHALVLKRVDVRRIDVKVKLSSLEEVLMSSKVSPACELSFS
ncbi:OLC1v1009660C1 [Oldenlandia corymbosa var. corymbosa]|uniref:OLC1v1009660C1 n=1 Tax=Oldenlandia corymbosa var. corymbosa TaxID=529605 RepID=A0AAV1DS44_OLDCO|nr:OLC1v1009660C1 [Oldenlandia corymbosa var. corymbosa]